MGGVSKAATKSKPVRMFVALDLPEIVREDIAAWGEAELTDPALRRVPPESLHVTLAFLGNRPTDDVERIAEAMEDAADRPVLIELRRAGRAAAAGQAAPLGAAGPASGRSRGCRRG